VTTGRRLGAQLSTRDSVCTGNSGFGRTLRAAAVTVSQTDSMTLEVASGPGAGPGLMAPFSVHGNGLTDEPSAVPIQTTASDTYCMTMLFPRNCSLLRGGADTPRFSGVERESLRHQHVTGGRGGRRDQKFMNKSREFSILKLSVGMNRFRWNFSPVPWIWALHVSRRMANFPFTRIFLLSWFFLSVLSFHDRKHDYQALRSNLAPSKSDNGVSQSGSNHKHKTSEGCQANGSDFCSAIVSDSDRLVTESLSPCDDGKSVQFRSAVQYDRAKTLAAYLSLSFILVFATGTAISRLICIQKLSENNRSKINVRSDEVSRPWIVSRTYRPRRAKQGESVQNLRDLLGVLASTQWQQS
jgi:hypothetical protein